MDEDKDYSVSEVRTKKMLICQLVHLTSFVVQEKTKETVLETISRVVAHHSQFWACLRDLGNQI